MVAIIHCSQVRVLTGVEQSQGGRTKPACSEMEFRFGETGASPSMIHLERISFTDMWKATNAPSSTPTSSPEPQHSYASPGTEPHSTLRRASPAINTQEQATLGKSLVIKGEVTGSEPLYIDGRVEGSINLPGNRVTVGRNGMVSANVSAREIVVLGKVRGNMTASDRMDIRGEGSLTGDVEAQRISIEEGAYFKGAVDIRKPGQKTNGESKETGTAPSETTTGAAAQVCNMNAPERDCVPKLAP
jgi:cytoskeletal protein CcmA (bactofilin family)